MLTKISPPNNCGTFNIIKFVGLSNLPIDKIQDNLDGWLLIKYRNGKIIMYNYNLNKYCLHDRIQIYHDGVRIIKQIDSFDQNNYLIATKIRKYVINRIKFFNNFFEIDSILGIGGEFYLYWKFLTIKKIIGMSNHQSIINDANNNLGNIYKNYLVDYNNIKSYPKILESDIILINVSQIHQNIIKYVKTIKFKKIILITCNLPDSKLKLLRNNFNIRSIEYFQNYDGLIRVIILENKI